MNAQALCVEAGRLGLRLLPRGDKLAVIPAKLSPAAFADELRQHKRELLDLMEARANHLPPDCAPWLHTARQVLEGQFDNADRSMREALVIGLRGINHEDCRRAMEKLTAQQKGRSS